MPSYAREFGERFEQAIKDAVNALEKHLKIRLGMGANREQTRQHLVENLETGGSLFAPMLRSIASAVSNAAMTAARQGTFIGHVIEDAKARSKLQRAGVTTAILRDVVDDAEADDADAIEQFLAGDIRETWVCALERTCEYCLPLHGKTMTREEWRERGLLPELIHSGRGWKSPCYCRLVAAEIAEGRAELLAPLKREKAERGAGRTKRVMLQTDIDKALAARDQALESEAGRRMLRNLGSALQEEAK